MKPGFKQTEVGAIPEDWSVSPLGHNLRRPPAYGINAPATLYDSDHPTYLRITDITEDCRYSEASKVSVKHPQANSYLLEQGDIVFARTGASVGKSYLYRPSDGPLVFAGFLIRLSPNKSTLIPGFLAYYAQSRTYNTWVQLNSTRTGQPGINGREYGTLPVPLPPTLAEQEAIASALGDADALIESLERLIAKKRDVKQGAMQELLTARRRLPGFTGKWERIEFGDIASIRNDKAVASSMPLGTQCVELESIGSGSGRLLGSVPASGSSPKYRFKRKDVLFGRLRAYLRKYWYATFDGVCSTEIWPLIPRGDRLDSGFLHLIVQTNEFVETAGVSYGTHMPRSDWSVMRRFVVQLPSLDEQTAIAAVLSDMDGELAALEAKLAKARAIKQGMMQELLTGRIRLK